MSVNNATIELIKEFEGCKLNAYKDAVGVWTIGYGTTSAAGVGIDPCPGMRITEEQAEFYLRSAIDRFADNIAKSITAPINDNEFGAFVSLAYNIGPGAFKKSSALREFNAGNKKKAADAILLWNKAGGKVLKGLTRRREAERALFLAPANGEKPADRSSPIKSTTMQASAVQIASGAGAGLTAIGALDGTAQIVALAFAAVGIIAAAWVMRERLKHWANGVR